MLEKGRHTATYLARAYRSATDYIGTTRDAECAIVDTALYAHDTEDANLWALKETVGAYIKAEQAPSDGSITGDRDRAKRKVAARHEMYAKHKALEANDEQNA